MNFDKQIDSLINYLTEVKTRGPGALNERIFEAAVAKRVRAIRAASTGQRQRSAKSSTTRVPAATLATVLQSLESRTENEMMSRLLEGGMAPDSALEFIKAQRLELDLDVNLSFDDGQED